MFRQCLCRDARCAPCAFFIISFARMTLMATIPPSICSQSLAIFQALRGIGVYGVYTFMHGRFLFQTIQSHSITIPSHTHVVEEYSRSRLNQLSFWDSDFLDCPTVKGEPPQKKLLGFWWVQPVQNINENKASGPQPACCSILWPDSLTNCIL